MIQSLPKNRFSKGKKSILDAIWTIENIKNHQTENPLRNLHMVLPVTIVLRKKIILQKTLMFYIRIPKFS